MSMAGGGCRRARSGWGMDVFCPFASPVMSDTRVMGDERNTRQPIPILAVALRRVRPLGLPPRNAHAVPELRHRRARPAMALKRGRTL